MKKLITIMTLIALTVITCPITELKGEAVGRGLVTGYQPVTEFLESNSTLSNWFMQFVDSSPRYRAIPKRQVFENFLKSLSGSEVLRQRSSRAGLTHNQLYAPIVSLLDEEWKSPNEMNEQERARIKLSMLELDIALAAVDATLPNTAHEEFRREVFRGAKPLSEVAKLPMSAVEAMTFTIMSHKLSDRINREPPTKIPPDTRLPVENPLLESEYMPW